MYTITHMTLHNLVNCRFAALHVTLYYHDTTLYCYDITLHIYTITTEPPTTTESPTTPTPGSQQDCPDVGVAIGITFLLTFLLTALLALLVIILVVICDRKHRRKCDVQQHVSSTDSLASQSTQQLP